MHVMEFDFGWIVFLDGFRPQHPDTLIAEHLNYREWSHNDHVVVVSLTISLGDLLCVIEGPRPCFIAVPPPHVLRRVSICLRCGSCQDIQRIFFPIAFLLTEELFSSD